MPSIGVHRVLVQTLYKLSSKGRYETHLHDQKLDKMQGKSLKQKCSESCSENRCYFFYHIDI